MIPLLVFNQMRSIRRVEATHAILSTGYTRFTSSSYGLGSEFYVNVPADRSSVFVFLCHCLKCKPIEQPSRPIEQQLCPIKQLFRPIEQQPVRSTSILFDRSTSRPIQLFILFKLIVCLFVCKIPELEQGIYAHESWFCLEFGYSRPINDKKEEIPLKDLSDEDKRKFSYEQKMIALIQQSIHDDIFYLLNHDGSSKSVWEALRVKAEGGKQIKKNKIALLKKEFDLFDSLKGETAAGLRKCKKNTKMQSTMEDMTRREIAMSTEMVILSFTKKEVVFDDVLAVIPLSGEYYSNIAKDKTGYLKKLDKIIRDVMTASLKKRDGERMNKNVEELVDDLKKVAEEVKVKAVKVEDEKIEEEKVKKESLVAGDEAGAGDEKKKNNDQTETAAENTGVSITKVLPKISVCQEECQSSLAQEEEAAEPCDG
uniref:Uncharacterized protein n=1 Tax=Helianthus annuus TaxID=4232 RepID=A0A251VGT4_HELAN